MLSLTKKTDYALIALAYLAERPDRTVSAREIAGGFQMPVALVMNILKTLHHAKWLASTRGAKGGYRLAADLTKVSMHDLIVILEGPVRLAECVLLEGECLGPECCKVGKGCPIQGPVTSLHHRMVGFLKDVKIVDVVKTNGHGNGNGCCAGATSAAAAVAVN